MDGKIASSSVVLGSACNKIEVVYDKIAGMYDSLFSDDASIQEDDLLFTQHIPVSECVLDVGCGTGLFLKYRQPSQVYTGVDPSSGMLAVLARNYPDRARDIFCCKFEDFNSPVKYDLIVSLYGAVNHIDPHSLSRIPQMLTQAGRFILMIFKPDYYPETYKRTGVVIPYWTYPLSSFSALQVQEFHNYLIVSGDHLSSLDNLSPVFNPAL